MSDPVKNAEVEDVLSSIRRLVSEDKRPMAKSHPMPAKDRLVLTPALRVAEAPDLDDPDEQSAPMQLRREATTTLRHAGAPDAQDRAGGDTDSDDADGDGGARQRNMGMFYHDRTGADAFEFARSPRDVDPDDRGKDDYGAGETGEAGFSHRVSDDDYDDRYVEDDGFDDEAAYDDEAAFDTYDDDHADEDAQADEEPIRAMSTADDDAPDDATARDDAPTHLDSAGGSDLMAKIAALEAVVGKISDNWEPDGAGTGGNSGTEAPAMEWEDDVERDATGARLDVDTAGEVDDGSNADAFATADPVETEARAGFDGRNTRREAHAPADEPAETETRFAPEGRMEAAEDTSATAIGGDDQILDEEALRDLVSEIVRSELQGALGERITRNVRKLVRREIHRALTAQELE